LAGGTIDHPAQYTTLIQHLLNGVSTVLAAGTATPEQTAMAVRRLVTDGIRAEGRLA
jgi:hypothetical protein